MAETAINLLFGMVAQHNIRRRGTELVGGKPRHHGVYWTATSSPKPIILPFKSQHPFVIGNFEKYGMPPIILLRS
jgi:hypothetical protein